MRASRTLSRPPFAVARPGRSAVVAAAGRPGSKEAMRSRPAPFPGTAAKRASSMAAAPPLRPPPPPPPLRLSSSTPTSSTSSAAAASSSSFSPSPSSPSTSTSRHAPLHDFCALIPFGFLIGVAALVSLFFFGACEAAGVCAAASATSLLSARLSLARWRAGASCAPVTSAAAAVVSSAAFWFYKAATAAAAAAAATAKTSLWSLRLGAVLSAAVALILWGNLLLGGNAPRRKTSAAS